MVEKAPSEQKTLKMNVLMERIRDRGPVEPGPMRRASTARDGELSKDGTSEEVTPEKLGEKKSQGGPGDQTPGAGPTTVAADDVRAAFARLAELEKIVKDKPPRGTDYSLVEALKAQTAAVVEAVKAKPERQVQSSTIKITPQIKWPVLGDDVGQDKCDVEELFERQDESCDLANDGHGMLPAERLTVLKQCLRGAKEKIYTNMQKKFKKTNLWQDSPEECYGLIKSRMMKFVETPLEKQTRLQQEWSELWKGRRAALQFEPLFEELVTELDAAGLGKSAVELKVEYLRKVGAQLAAEINKDMRPWPDPVTNKITPLH